MHVFDLGYFKLERFEQLEAAGAYFCCRYKAATQMQRLDDPERAWADSPLEWLDALPSSVQQVQWRVLLGKKARLEVRLLAVRVPAEVAQSRRHKCLEQSRSKGQKVSAQRLELCHWQLFVTNAPESLLNVEQACVLYGLRWQIERLFRLWKETLQVDLWRSQKPQRVLCELYAKLTGALLTQKITAFCAWHEPARSLVKCAQTIAQHAMSLLTHLRFDSALRRTLRALQKACLCAAKVETRKAKPATFQRLIQPQIS